jgi:hypothetical protein
LDCKGSCEWIQEVEVWRIIRKDKNEQGSDCGLESKLTQHGPNMDTYVGFLGQLTKWSQKLFTKINQLFQLCSIELDAAK